MPDSTFSPFFTNSSAAHHFALEGHRNGKQMRKATKISTSQAFLCDPTIPKAAFRMDNVWTMLYLDHKLFLSNGKGLSAVKEFRHSLAALLAVLDNKGSLDRKMVRNIFHNGELDTNTPSAISLQAWAAHYAAALPHMVPRLMMANSIDTSTLDRQMVRFLAKTIRDMNQRINPKPTRLMHEVKCEPSSEMDNLSIRSERYKTKVSRTAGNQKIEVTFEHEGKIKTVRTRTLEVNGCSATLAEGKDSSPEVLKDDILLRGLQNCLFLSTNPFIELICCPPSERRPVKKPFIERAFNKKPYTKKQNKKNSRTKGLSTDLQQPDPPRANPPSTEAILSIDINDRVVLIHGPPGTGKTTDIAAAVTSTMSSQDKNATTWLVAQSNVAVKNIAEKLASLDYLDFKILVSKDFYFDWHEHLYEKVSQSIISSEDFPSNVVEAERLALGSRAVLCTLSMLSNVTLSHISSLVSLQTVVFDEASQIKIGDYVSLLVHFRTTICRLVFIGDDKQLAPHGSNDISGLESIFEKGHLRENAIFLDIQYWMPFPIGRCILENIYGDFLKSQYPISDVSCCRFVDVADGVEEFGGSSWINTREADVVIEIARQLASEHRSFRVITPYDAQRSLLERSLKQADLPWKDKCFNTDSFQGNEDDYIIISVGVNVMLTRCKKGMVICTNRDFIEGPATASLIAKLLGSLGQSPWTDTCQVLQDGGRLFDKN